MAGVSGIGGGGSLGGVSGLSMIGGTGRTVSAAAPTTVAQMPSNQSASIVHLSAQGRELALQDVGGDGFSSKQARSIDGLYSANLKSVVSGCVSHHIPLESAREDVLLDAGAAISELNRFSEIVTALLLVLLLANHSSNDSSDA